MSQDSADGRFLIGLLALLVTGWGILGWLDLPLQVRAGYHTNSQGIVTGVDAGSPAELAGLKTGDHIKVIDSIKIEDAARIARQPLKKAGDIQHITVANDDLNFKLMRIKYEQIPPRELNRDRIAVIVGFCFLLFPLAALFLNGAEPSRVLTVMGVGLSLAFLAGPQITDFGVRSLTTAINSLFVMVGVAAVLQFLLVFPHRRPWLNRRYGKLLLFLPAFLLWLLIAWRVLFTPAASDRLNSLTSVMAGVIIGAYLLVSVFQFLRNYSRTNRAERKALKLNWMLLGTILGVAPVTIAQLTATFSPQAGLPGQDYYFITLALIPMTWARSASLRS